MRIPPIRDGHSTTGAPWSYSLSAPNFGDYPVKSPSAAQFLSKTSGPAACWRTHPPTSCRAPDAAGVCGQRMEDLLEGAERPNPSSATSGSTSRAVGSSAAAKGTRAVPRSPWMPTPSSTSSGRNLVLVLAHAQRGRGDLADGQFSSIDEVGAGTVESFVVAVADRRQFGAVGVALGGQELGRLRIEHGFPDLRADELGGVRVGFSGCVYVVEGRERAGSGSFSALPCSVVRPVSLPLGRWVLARCGRR